MSEALCFSSTMDGSVPSSVSCKFLGATLHCPCKQSRLSPNGISTAESPECPPPQHVLHNIPPYIHVCVHHLECFRVKGMCCLREDSPVCQTETKKWQAESPHGGWMLARACQTRVSCAVSVYSKCRLSEPQPGLHCVKSGGVTIGTLQRCRAS